MAARPSDAAEPTGAPVRGVRVGFVARAEPLAVRGACALGVVAVRLARRLLAGDDAALARLEGVAGPGLLCVRGAGEALPWVDGLTYLGVDAQAPGLLVPTTLALDVPAPLALQALERRAPAPLALLPGLIVPLAAARPLERASLCAWLDAELARAEAKHPIDASMPSDGPARP